MASELQKVIRRYRRLVFKRDQQMTRRMITEWQDLSETLQSELAKVSEKIEQAVLAGKLPGVGPETAQTFSRAWLMQRDRLAMLSDQAGRMAEKAIGSVIGEVAEAQSELARLGILYGNNQLEVLAASFSKLNAPAIESFVGALQAGSPLAELFAALPGSLGSDFSNAISRGIALGLNPKQVARQVQKGVGLNLYRANLIARTEMLRSFREGTREMYRANRDIVGGLIWVCALDRRTCAACWGMAGREFPLDAEMNDHPNGRCTFAPKVVGVESMLPDRDARFAELSAVEQRRILGKTGYERRQAGDASFDDFATIKSNARWGSHPTVTAARDLPG